MNKVRDVQKEGIIQNERSSTCLKCLTSEGPFVQCGCVGRSWV